MMRSLYSAITGLKNHQTSMDVIGNNISNVNTAGYKRQRTSFATMLGQELRGSSAPTANVGGTNGVVIGLGSVLGSVDKVMGQGSSQYTGKATDMMIQGEGMFVLKQATGQEAYTRVGNFDFDQDGYLIDVGTGSKVQGYKNTAADVTTGTPITMLGADWDGTNAVLEDADMGAIRFKIGNIFNADPTAAAAFGTPTATDYTLSSFSIDKTGIITGVYSNGTDSFTRQIYRLAVADFANEGGLIPEGNNYYSESNNSGTARVGFAGNAGRGIIMPNYLEMSNVDLSQEFTDMIVTQRGFQANSRVITVSDSLLQELIDLKRG